MPNPPLTYAAFLLIAGSLGVVALLLAWRRRSAPGGAPLIGMMITLITWTWTYALFWLSPQYPAPFFWLDMTYLGVVFMPVAQFVFAYEVIRHKKWRDRPTLAALLVIPLATLVILWTDPYHGLFFAGARSPGEGRIFSGGPWFWVNVIYSYALVLGAYGMLLVGFVRSRASLYRRQLGIALLGVVVPLVVNILGIFGVHFLPELDLTPILFSITGLFFTIGLVTFRLLDIVPVAQSVLLDQMNDGMLVLDAKGRIIELNNAACKLFGRRRSSLIGKGFSITGSSFAEIIEQSAPLRLVNKQITFGDNPGQVLDVQVTPLQAESSLEQTLLVTWRDVTRLKQTEEELRIANQALTEHVRKIEALQEILKEQAIRDPLTGLFNRRFFENALPKELARAQRNGSPVSFLLIDIDHFKRINDRYGHDAGDLALKRLAEALEPIFRNGDWVIRYGGEEFLAVLPESALEDGRRRAEQIRQVIEKLEFPEKDHAYRLTVSVGVAAYPQHGRDYNQIFRAVDQALYHAKTAGRNQVGVAVGGLPADSVN